MSRNHHGALPGCPPSSSAAAPPIRVSDEQAQHPVSVDSRQPLSLTHTDSLNIPVSAHLTYLTAQVEPSASGHCTSRWKLGKAVGDSDRGAATAAAPGQAACARGSARGGEGRRQRRPASMNGRLGAGKQYQSTARPSAGRPAGRTSASFRHSKSSETGRNLSLYLNCNLHW